MRDAAVCDRGMIQSKDLQLWQPLKALEACVRDGLTREREFRPLVSKKSWQLKQVLVRAVSTRQDAIRGL